MKNKKKKITIWEGVYKNFKTAGYDSDTNYHFNSEEYLKVAKSRFENNIKKGQNYSLFNLVLISLMYKSNKSLTVLDFGSGVGESIARLCLSKIKNKKIHFFLLDNIKIRLLKKNFLENLFKYSQNKISFIDNINEIKKKVEVILFGSVIQYIDEKNFIELLRKIIKKKPDFIVLEDVFISNKQFVTLQKFYSFHKVPFLFYTKIKLFKIFGDFNYSPIFYEDRAPTSSSQQFYSMKKFPKELQVERSKNIVFIKNKN